MCGSSEYPYPHHGRLFDLHPPPNPKDFPFQGVFDDPPTSPQEFPEFLNRDFPFHSLEIQNGFGALKQRKWILTLSVTKIW